MEDKDKFYSMLTPRLRQHWNLETDKLNIDSLNSDLGYMSEGERTFALFCVSVWNGQSAEGFDLICGFKSLDPEHQAVITGWFNDPFWP